ncbi:MAG: hypothetical protein GQ567_06415 [Methanosarcinales archaeon]|nr:hypothetical protein [Methanosarcinales archaeon]
MNKKAMLAMVALVTVSIMLASGAVAQLIGPGMPGPDMPGDEENAELIDEIMEGVADQGGITTRAEVAAALMQAEAMGADLDGTTVKTSADMSENDMGCCGIGQCDWHMWIWVCPPVYETHAALLWNECSDSDLDLYICNAGGYAVSNADHTLTEEVAVTGCGVNYIWVHAPKADCGYQPYVLAVDCELPKICGI